MKRPIILALLLLFSCRLLAGVIKGKVTDEHGQTLPYATIYLQGTTIGVTSNGKGDYELTVEPGLYKVVCQYIGFKQSTFNISITGNETVEHSFVLKDQSLEMKEIVVKASTEDPAYPIIRNAIKRRKFHLSQVKSFQTSIYLKGAARSRKMPKKFMGQKVTDETDVVDSVGKGVLYLTEENADYYSDGDRDKTVIHSVHVSGNDNGLGFSRFPSVITFYDNNVNIFGSDSRGFISPISENALFYYKYKLLGQFEEQGHTIYKIQVKQKRSYEPCFDGTIYIVDDEWAIHSLNMTLVKKSGMDIVDTMMVNQLFLPLQKDTWVIKNQLLYFTVNMFGFDVTASAATVYNNQKVNQPIPDSIFAGRVVSIYDKGANKKDSSFWTEARPIPLEGDEKNDFVKKDSLVKKYSDPAYLDSMRRKGNKIKPLDLLVAGLSYSTKKNKNRFSVNNMLLGLGADNMINYNTVEGFNVAPKISWYHRIDTGHSLYTEIAPRYGFSNSHFNTIGRVYYYTYDRAFPGRSWTVGVEGGKYVFQYNPANPVSPWLNSFYALLYRENDMKVYERWDATAYVGHNHGNGLNWYIKASYQQRLPLQNTTTYSFIKGDANGFKTNAPIYLVAAATTWEQHDAAIAEAMISYKPGYTYIQYPDRKVPNGSSWPRFTFTYKKGIPDIVNSKSDFDQWRFSVQDDMNMKLLGTFSYNVVVGGFLSSKYVSIPDLTHLYGNRGIGYASPYLHSFQFAPYYDFSNKEANYYEGHVEYHLKGLISNKIPLLRQARWYLLCGGNAFYVSDKLYYTEGFVGLDNIGFKLVRLLRVDFVQAWDSRMGHNSGLRFSLNVNGGTTRSYPLHGEW